MCLPPSFFPGSSRQLNSLYPISFPPFLMLSFLSYSLELLRSLQWLHSSSLFLLTRPLPPTGPFPSVFPPYPALACLMAPPFNISLFYQAKFHLPTSLPSSIRLSLLTFSFFFSFNFVLLFLSFPFNILPLFPFYLFSLFHPLDLTPICSPRAILTLPLWFHNASLYFLIFTLKWNNAISPVWL